ncbi:MAG: tRNA pseudouridine(38-40) synthase TruA [Candidatus Lokiarchaeota archaeon]|nr:tRNA pseudouridine(38-40) synthase TruA [Candidatus Lokiarchaeota archaeon]
MTIERKYFIKYYYIGVDGFYGSQRQTNHPSIEESIVNALKIKNYIKDTKSSEFRSASRTDRYVSARGAVFSFKIKKNLVLMEINSALPKEIGLWSYAMVPNDYSPRFNAIQRHYKYIFPYPISYLKKNYSIDLDIMKNACEYLKGVHNFKNFSKRNKELTKETREMKYVKLNVNDDVLSIDFKSQGFLRQQIRRIIKKIFELGNGEITFNDFIDLFDTQEYISYEPADPRGLILWDIEYDLNVKFIVDEKSINRLNQYFHFQKYDYWLNYNLFNMMQKYDFS